MIALEPGTILDHNGEPIRADRGQSYDREPRRRSLDDYVRTQPIAGKSVNMTYDVARLGDEYKNAWANADALDADSANSFAVRQKLVQYSRYEFANNGYFDGIANTFANDVVGSVGPKLRLLTQSPRFNRMVEDRFEEWATAANLRRKLWTMCRAKIVDGEAIGLIKINRNVNDPVKLSVQLIETEQCQTPMLPWGVPNYIDGIRFDEFGDPLWYDILKEHPGSNNQMTYDMEAMRVPSNLVMHWFKEKRPGQHRGIPEFTSTLNLGIAWRRMRESTLTAANVAASLGALILESKFPSNDDYDLATPLDTMEFERGMMTVMPDGMEGRQLKAEHPNANYDMFGRANLTEQARPLSMPYNKAAGDSSQSNFASGKLDHLTYYKEVDVHRYDCGEMALDKLFAVWFQAAIVEYGWLGGLPENLSPRAYVHTWDWEKHQVADEEAEANANRTKLSTGESNLVELLSRDGNEFGEHVAKLADAYQIEEEQMRLILLTQNLPQHQIPFVVNLLETGSMLRTTRQETGVPSNA